MRLCTSLLGPLLLSAITTVLALEPDGISPDSTLDDQPASPCGDAAPTITQRYDAAYLLEGGACPPGGYYAVGGAGCCANDQAAKTIGSLGIGCCPCGAACTGYLPQAKQWVNGKMVRMAVATEAPAEKWYL